MVLHALPVATTSTYSLDRDASSSPDEPPPSALLSPLSPLSPMWDLSLNDDDTRPADTLEVPTLLSRPVSPLSHPEPGVQDTEGDRVTLPSRSNATMCDLDPKAESQCGQLRPSVVPPDGLSGASSAMFETFFSSPIFDGVPSDDFLRHSNQLSGGKGPLTGSDAGTFSPNSPFSPPLLLRRRISLPPASPELPPTDTLDTLVSVAE
jgi:hypothetical protein